jgi:hypothetical protein
MPRLAALAFAKSTRVWAAPGEPGRIYTNLHETTPKRAGPASAKSARVLAAAAGEVAPIRRFGLIRVPLGLAPAGPEALRAQRLGIGSVLVFARLSLNPTSVPLLAQIPAGSYAASMRCPGHKAGEGPPRLRGLRFSGGRHFAISSNPGPGSSKTKPQATWSPSPPGPVLRPAPCLHRA